MRQGLSRLNRRNGLKLPLYPFSFLAGRNRGDRDPLGFHQGFQQRHGLGERIRAAAIAARAAGDFEGRAAVGVFSGQVRAIGDQEFDELVEAVFGRAVQSGLVRDGIRARHLTAAAEGLCDLAEALSAAGA